MYKSYWKQSKSLVWRYHSHNPRYPTITLERKRIWATRYCDLYFANYGANTDYQDVVYGTKVLAAYLVNHSSYREAIPEVSATNPFLESVAQSNRKSKPETCAPTCPDCRTVLIGDNETTHSCLYPQSTPAPSTGPLDSFFRSFSGYQYDPSIPPAESFRSFRRGLKRWSDWDGYSPDTWKEYKEDVYTRYQAALTKEFNLWFGTEDDIMPWHSLCRAIAIHPLPPTCELCREVGNRFYNNPFFLFFFDLRGVYRR